MVVQFYPSLVSLVLESVLERLVDGLRGAFLSNRSEWPQNRQRNHPRHREMDTSRLNEVKAPLHDGTPRSHLDNDRLVFLPREDRFRSSAIPQYRRSVVRDGRRLESVGPQFVGRRV